MMELFKLKYQFVKFIENIPMLQIFIYNNLSNFKFLFPHDKDYLALKLLFSAYERRDFIDVGGNIGLSSIGFREMGFKNNTIHIFEPDNLLLKNYLNKLKKNYERFKIYNFGLYSKNCQMKIHKAFYNNKYFHFNNSFDRNYIKNKLRENYPKIHKKFKLNQQKLILKKFDSLNLNLNACFIKIDVEGLDHEVLKGMMKFIKLNKPVILIEYNYSNFGIIYNIIKKYYDCYRYEVEKNKLLKLKKNELIRLINGNILETKYKKNSVNLYYLKKNYNFRNKF